MKFMLYPLLEEIFQDIVGLMCHTITFKVLNTNNKIYINMLRKRTNNIYTINKNRGNMLMNK